MRRSRNPKKRFSRKEPQRGYAATKTRKSRGKVAKAAKEKMFSELGVLGGLARE